MGIKVLLSSLRSKKCTKRNDASFYLFIDFIIQFIIYLAIHLFIY